ncbi:hypothetical protein ACFLQ8_03135 [Candidatus Auribacterota bacterium]
MYLKGYGMYTGITYQKKIVLCLTLISFLISNLPLYAFIPVNDKLAPPTSFETNGKTKEAADQKLGLPEEVERKTYPCHLPLYLWRPLLAKLTQLHETGQFPSDVYERIVNQGLGVARVDAEYVVGDDIVFDDETLPVLKIVIEKEAIPILKDVLFEQLEEVDFLTDEDVIEYLTLHEEFHLIVNNYPNLIKDLSTQLKDPLLYDPKSPIPSYEKLKEFFINNYGEEYEDDLKFTQELYVVYHIEKEQLSQKVKVLPLKTIEKKARIPLPNIFARVIEESKLPRLDRVVSASGEFEDIEEKIQSIYKVHFKQVLEAAGSMQSAGLDIDVIKDLIIEKIPDWNSSPGSTLLEIGKIARSGSVDKLVGKKTLRWQRLAVLLEKAPQKFKSFSYKIANAAWKISDLFRRGKPSTKGVERSQALRLLLVNLPETYGPYSYKAAEAAIIMAEAGIYLEEIEYLLLTIIPEKTEIALRAEFALVAAELIDAGLSFDKTKNLLIDKIPEKFTGSIDALLAVQTAEKIIEAGLGIEKAEKFLDDYFAQDMYGYGNYIRYSIVTFRKIIEAGISVGNAMNLLENIPRKYNYKKNGEAAREYGFFANEALEAALKMIEAGLNYDKIEKFLLETNIERKYDSDTGSHFYVISGISGIDVNKVDFLVKAGVERSQAAEVLLIKIPHEYKKNSNAAIEDLEKIANSKILGDKFPEYLPELLEFKAASKSALHHEGIYKDIIEIKKTLGNRFLEFWALPFRIAQEMMNESPESSVGFREVLRAITEYLQYTSKDISEISSNIEIIKDKYIELKKARILVTPALLNPDITTTRIISRMAEIRRGMEGDDTVEPFNVNNPVDVDLNYLILRKEEPRGTRLSYDGFMDYINKIKRNPYQPLGVSIPPLNLIQLRALVYEAYKILELVNDMRRKSDRPIVIVANKSYGPYALSPVRDILTNMGVKIIETKMGSTSCHANPYRVSWNSRNDGIWNRMLFDEDERGIIEMLVSEKPHVVFVDGSYSLDPVRMQQFRRKDPKYADAYQGIRNWFIALVEGMKNKDRDVNWQEDFQKPESFLEELYGEPDFMQGSYVRGWEPGWEEQFSNLVKRVSEVSAEIKTEPEESYHMRFWTPANVPLKICEATDIQPHGDYRPEEPKKLDPNNDLKRPTVVMLQTAMESKTIYPEFIGPWVNYGMLDKPIYQTGKNTAAYYDDKTHFDEFRFIYEPESGVMLSTIYERTAKQLMEEELLEIVDAKGVYSEYVASKQITAEEKDINACLFDLTGTLATFKGEIPDFVADKLNDLLRRGIKVAIVTDDTEKHDLERRVIDRLDQPLLKNLSIYLNGGNTLWQFNIIGEKQVNLDNQMFPEMKNRVENHVGEILGGMNIPQYKFDSNNYHVSIDLTKHIKATGADRDKIRRDIIKQIEKTIASKIGVNPRIYLAGRHHIGISLHHKPEAVDDFMQRNNLEESELLIAGNEAGSRKNDREMLKAFPLATKINVGRLSKSLSRRVLDNIYQIGTTNNRNMTDMVKLLRCIKLKKLNLTKLGYYSILKPKLVEPALAGIIKPPYEMSTEVLAPTSPSHLPLYLWKPFKAKLTELHEAGQFPADAYDRIVNQGLGVARYDDEGGIVIEQAAVGVLKDILNKERSPRAPPLKEQNIIDYLTYHEKIHQEIKQHPHLIKNLLTQLKAPFLYSPNSQIPSYDKLKEFFVNNYGGEYEDDLKLAEELYVVWIIESEILDQAEPVRLVANAIKPKERIAIPEVVKGILEKTKLVHLSSKSKIAKIVPPAGFPARGKSEDTLKAKESVFPIIEKDDKERVLKIIGEDGRLLVEREYLQTEDNEYVIEKIYSYAPDGSLARAVERKRQTIDGVHRRIIRAIGEQKTSLEAEIEQETDLALGSRKDKVLEDAEGEFKDEVNELRRRFAVLGNEKIKEMRLRSRHLSEREKEILGTQPSEIEEEKNCLISEIYDGKNDLVGMYEEKEDSEDLSLGAKSVISMSKESIVGNIEKLYGLDPDLAKLHLDGVIEDLGWEKIDNVEFTYLRMKLLALEGDTEAYNELSMQVDHPVPLIRYLARSARFLKGDNTGAQDLFELWVRNEIKDINLIHDFFAENATELFKDHLIKYFQDPKNVVSEYLVYSLGKIDDPAIPAIMRDLLAKTDDTSVAACCIKYLGESNVREAKDDILRFIGDDSPIRLTAMEALADLEAEEVIPHLIDKLDSDISSLEEHIVSSGKQEEVSFKVGLGYLNSIVKMNVVEAAPKVRKLIDLFKKANIGRHDIVLALNVLFRLERQKALTEVILPYLKELTSSESLSTWDANDEIKESEEYRMIHDVLDSFFRKEAYLEFSDIIIKELKLIAVNQPSQKLLRLIDHTIQHLKVYSALHACSKEPEKISNYARDLVGYMDTLDANINILKEQFEKNPELVDRLMEMVLRYHLAQHEAMRLLALSDKYVKKLFGQLKEPVVIEEKKKMLFDAFLDNNINSIVTNYTERYPHYGTFITLKEKDVYFPDLDTASVIEFFARCGIALDEEQMRGMISKNPYFRLTGGLFVPKLSLILSSYRGSREKEDSDAKFSTRAITVGLRYRGAEVARSVGLPMLYEWDLSIHETYMQTQTDHFVAMAFYFYTSPPEHIRKRKILVFDYFDFDIVKAMIRQQEKEYSLKEELCKKLEMFGDIEDSPMALKIFGKDDSDPRTIRGIIDRLKTETGLLPAYIEYVYGSFDDIKDKLSELLQSGNIEKAKELIQECETVGILKFQIEEISLEIEDRNSSFAITELDEECFERDLELDEVSKPSPVNIDEINASEALKGVSY